MILAGPPSATASRTARFSFAGDGATGFRCSLDGSAFEACRSPRVYSGLADGAHRFRVRAGDAAGNEDPSPAARAFEVDRAVDAGLMRGKRRGRLGRDLRLKAIASMSEPGRVEVRARFRVAGRTLRSHRASARFLRPGRRVLILGASPRVDRALRREVGRGSIQGVIRARFTDAVGNDRIFKRGVRLTR
jgi:hypothetical protein